MTEGVWIRDIENEKARRRAARAMIGEYHEQQLRLLLERVRDGFARLDADDIDPFDLDDLIHHYKRSAQKLWSFCGSSGGGSERAALTSPVLDQAPTPPGFAGVTCDSESGRIVWLGRLSRTRR
jgi:hypothetical protein